MASGRLKQEARVRTTRAVDKHGARLYIDISFFLVKDPAGNVVGAAAIGRDVTAAWQKKQAEKAAVLHQAGAWVLHANATAAMLAATLATGVTP